MGFPRVNLTPRVRGLFAVYSDPALLDQPDSLGGAGRESGLLERAGDGDPPAVSPELDLGHLLGDLALLEPRDKGRLGALGRVLPMKARDHLPRQPELHVPRVEAAGDLALPLLDGVQIRGRQKLKSATSARPRWT